MLDPSAARRPQPVDATAKFSGAGVSTTDSRTGLAVRASALRRQIRAAIVSTPADRTFIARTASRAAEGHQADLDETYDTVSS